MSPPCRSWRPAWIALALPVAACGRGGAPPELIAVADVSPGVVQAGDRLEVAGTGFAEGRVARVVARGSVHRPGQPPVRREVVLGEATARGARVVVPVSEQLVAELLDPAPSVTHGTFRGDLEVAFLARSTAAPAVAGTLRGVTLDLERPSAAEAAQAAERAGPLLAFYGVELGPAPDGRPALVTALVHAGRAERAGLLAGDVIESVGGVTFRAADDLEPPPAATAEVVVTRGPARRPVTRVVDVSGYHPLDLAAIARGAVPALLAALLVLGLARPPSRRLEALANVIALRGRASAAEPAEAMLAVVVRRLAVLASAASLGALAYGASIVAADLDVLLLSVSGLTAIAVAGVIVGGGRVARGWSLGAGLRAGAVALALALPLATTVASMALSAGSARVSDLVRAQGAWPWQWAIALPHVALPFALAAVAALVRFGPPPSALPEADLVDPRAPRGGALPSVAAAADAALPLATACVGALLVLGGWQLPGVTDPDRAGSGLLRVAGALVVLAKGGVLLVGLAAARRIAPRVAPAELLRAVWLALAAVLVVGIGGGYAWAELSRVPVARQVVALAGALAVLLVAVLTGRLAARAVAHARSRDAHVNPWL
ncbi:MAG: NADH-quinone oxidoreductase subunit H [Polyangiaceae bacterium]|nr:NADH-quinone oxidoreductase subunit H [Polyangiaceae bacterium]